MADSATLTVSAGAGTLPRVRLKPERRTLYGALLLCVVALFTAAPVLYVIVTSFDVALPHQPYAFGLEGWIEVFDNRKTWNSVLVTLTLTLRAPIAICVAFVVCWLLVRIEIPGRRFIELTLWFGFFLPGVPMAMGWILLLDESHGLLNLGLKQLGLPALFGIHSVPGIMWVHFALTTVPVMVILLAPAFRQLDAAFEEAAEVSGSGIGHRLRRITIPLLAPALMTAFIASLIRSLEAFEIEQLLGTPAGIYNYGTRVYDLIFREPPLLPQALALSALFLAILVVLAIPYHRFLLRAAGRPTISGRGVRIGAAARPAWTFAASAFVILYVVITIILPFAVLIAGSFTRLFGFFFLKDPWTTAHWTAILADDRFARAALNSIGLGLAVGIVGIVVFALLAWALVRTDWKYRSWVSLLVWLPWAIPGLVLSLTLMSLMISLPLFTWLNGTILPLVVAMLIKELPIGVQLVRASLTQVSRQLEEAAEISGAGFLWLFVRVTLPLIAPTLVAVFLLVFAATVRDISTIVLIAAPGMRTLSLLMFDFAVSGRFEPSAVLGVIVAAISLATTIAAVALGRHVGIGR